jgi:hypothetical protein
MNIIKLYWSRGISIPNLIPFKYSNIYSLLFMLKKNVKNKKLKYRV